MATNKKVVYTAKVHTTGGRANGTSRSDDGILDVKLASPGAGEDGTNPEQLFAAGWSTCFISSMGIAANKMRTILPVGTAADAEVDLCVSGRDFFIQGRLNLRLPGMDRKIAQEIVDHAHQICTYSKAIRGNVETEIKLTV